MKLFSVIFTCFVFVNLVRGESIGNVSTHLETSITTIQWPSPPSLLSSTSGHYSWDKNLTKNNSLCQKDVGNLHLHEVQYNMSESYKIFKVQNMTYIAINITEIPENATFLIAQAHSRTRYLILSHVINPASDRYINSTNPGLLIENLDDQKSSRLIYLTNCHNKILDVLFMVRNYSNNEPIPGAFPTAVDTNPDMPQPYLVISPNILTTEITFRAAAFSHHNLSVLDTDLHYKTYLTYMYEKNLNEKNYWNTLIATSTVDGILNNGKLVSFSKNNNTAAQLNRYFVSYSGVGAVITVMVSYNNSGGVLYTSAVSYGCDFLDTEEYRCTKLINPLAKLFCASLLFIGGILLFFGHRWLNFTMFISGFMFFWLILFLLFAQIHSVSINVLGWTTLVGAVTGGMGWLMMWHKFQRPFHSALLIITMNVIFVGMVVTYFLRYVISPHTSLAAFVVFPVIFAIVIIAYSIADIKKVHIFSCTFLGSYAFIVPFAFYSGSSLTYIVINVLGIITVKHYSDTLGYPPFQEYDIILLCLWIFLFTSGMIYQLYKERSGPPFYPPNRSSWIAFKKAFNFILDKIFICLPLDTDSVRTNSEDNPMWRLKLNYCYHLLQKRLSCQKYDLSESGYRSLHQARNVTENSDDTEPEIEESRFKTFKQRFSKWLENIHGRLKKDDEELLQAQDIPEESVDEEMLQDPSQSYRAFGRTQVVFEDVYGDQNQSEA